MVEGWKLEKSRKSGKWGRGNGREVDEETQAVLSIQFKWLSVHLVFFQLII
jgi:hypothetical protein